MSGIVKRIGSGVGYVLTRATESITHYRYVFGTGGNYVKNARLGAEGGDALLKEDGGFLLKEDGGKILLE